MSAHGFVAPFQHEFAAALPVTFAVSARIDAELQLRQAAPSLGSIVLEFTNLPPYREALMRAVGVPVHDCDTLLRWLWAGAARPAPPEPSR